MTMKRNKPQFWRLVELDRQIREGKHPNCLTFADKWEVAQKTVQRDIDYLKYSLEAPIEYDRIKKGYYYTDKSWFLPSLNMSEGDLLVLLVASRAMEQYRGTPVAGKLEQIFNKIAEMIPDRISIKPELVFSRFSFTSPPAKPIDEKIWVQIVRGLLTQRKVKMTYQAFESTAAKAWLFSPYHMANLQGEWYAFGTTESGDMVVQFSLARITAAHITDIPFTIPGGFYSKNVLAAIKKAKEAGLKTVCLTGAGGGASTKVSGPGRTASRRTRSAAREATSAMPSALILSQSSPARW